MIVVYVIILYGSSTFHSAFLVNLRTKEIIVYFNVCVLFSKNVA
jgi:hypothetical protein